MRFDRGLKPLPQSTFLTGFLSDVRQPLRFHVLIQLMMPLRRYWLSVWRSTRHGRLSASSAAIAAISSMRLLVVWVSPPLSSLSLIAEAQDRAPAARARDSPEQAPSVWMMTCGNAIGHGSANP